MRSPVAGAETEPDAETDADAELDASISAPLSPDGGEGSPCVSRIAAGRKPKNQKSKMTTANKTANQAK